MNVPPTFYTMHPYQRASYLLNTHQATTWREAMKKAVRPVTRPAPVQAKPTVMWWQKD